MFTYFAVPIQQRNEDGTPKAATVPNPVPGGAPSTVPVYEKDAVGTLISGVYQGERKQPGDILLARRADPVAALERFIGKDVSAWAVANGSLVPCFDELKRRKLAEVEREHAADMADGITVGGMTLAAGVQDVNTFANQITLMATAESLLPEESREAFRATQQNFWEKDGTIHQATVTELRVLLVQYGMAVQAAKSAVANRRIAVSAASTVEALNAA